MVNAAKVKLTGKKERQDLLPPQRLSGRHSGHAAGALRTNHPERLIENAVVGMLPKNRLSRALATKLKVYAGAEHPHQAQQPEALAAVG